MNREIKFQRVYRGFTEENKGKIHFIEWGPIGTDSSFKSPSYVHGFEFISDRQYTGLKDKNGREIYEGDIIRNHQAEVNEVMWYGAGWCYRNFHANALRLDDTWNPYIKETTEHEVIGNIYENSELLTTK